MFKQELVEKSLPSLSDCPSLVSIIQTKLLEQLVVLPVIPPQLSTQICVSVSILGLYYIGTASRSQPVPVQSWRCFLFTSWLSLH